VVVVEAGLEPASELLDEGVAVLEAGVAVSVLEGAVPTVPSDLPSVDLAGSPAGAWPGAFILSE
jgi:hypothetical protein